MKVLIKLKTDSAKNYAELAPFNGVNFFDEELRTPNPEESFFDFFSPNIFNKLFGLKLEARDIDKCIYFNGNLKSYCFLVTALGTVALRVDDTMYFSGSRHAFREWLPQLANLMDNEDVPYTYIQTDAPAGMHPNETAYKYIARSNGISEQIVAAIRYACEHRMDEEGITKQEIIEEISKVASMYSKTGFVAQSWWEEHEVAQNFLDEKENPTESASARKHISLKYFSTQFKREEGLLPEDAEYPHEALEDIRKTIRECFTAKEALSILGSWLPQDLKIDSGMIYTPDGSIRTYTSESPLSLLIDMYGS